ncbi:DUF4256 domain-containing protein [Fontibacter flavus]|uniref:DUF4256 domain-containing protein n=1 Tax=Fontibacter flavus TaxID=654838 RepID=A0ABV6FSY5_9BACT
MKKLSPQQEEEYLGILQSRFNQNPQRHPNLIWEQVKTRLLEFPDKLSSLYDMENTGGEPDVVSQDSSSGAFVFFDCSAETPLGRRSFCYDQTALDSRKANKPQNSAKAMADMMGVNLLTEEEYFYLQTLGDFDTKTSSWLETPVEIRKKGGAIFGDKRFGRTFIYHNGAESYYGVRGFRASLRV